MTTTKRPATYQDVLDAPETVVAELIDGELTLSPRPSGGHAVVAALLGAELIPRFWHGNGGPGGWIILGEPELHLGERVLVPDLAGWRTERMATAPYDHKFVVVPDWICEIASKSTRTFDEKQKLPIYARAGVAHAWVLDPSRRVLQVYRHHEQHWLRIGYFSGNELVRAEPFDEMALDLGLLWRNLPVPTRASESSPEYEVEY